MLILSVAIFCSPSHNFTTISRMILQQTYSLHQPNFKNEQHEQQQAKQPPRSKHRGFLFTSAEPVARSTRWPALGLAGEPWGWRASLCYSRKPEKATDASRWLLSVVSVAGSSRPQQIKQSICAGKQAFTPNAVFSGLR